MACFLIDFENQNCKSLEGISLLGLNEKDELVFFYSYNSSRITMELHKEIDKMPVKKTYISVEAGTPNALDFQLSTYLGARVTKEPDTEYYIVANDCGYDCVCHYWKERNIAISRIKRIYHFDNADNNL